jgi:uncharacterized membrane protein HdeD (DUF308 family)
MASIYDRLVNPDSGNARIARLWWVMALKGVSAIVLGLLAVLLPAITLLTLALIFAAYCIVDAVFSTLLAVRGARRHQRWWWPALNALVAIAAAVTSLLYPGLTVLVFVIMFAAWALVSGLVSIVAAFRLRSDHGRWWMIASGVISALLGLLLLAQPAVGLLTLTWLIAFQSWLAGGALLSLAYQLRLRQRLRMAGERRRPESIKAA